jgi:aspartate-semialdehyde dehydrogenase
MTEGPSAYRVGLKGASTLLGKEILTVLKARNFPVTYVIGVEDRSNGLDAPVLNIGDDPIPVIEASGEGAACELLFLASRSVLPTEQSEWGNSAEKRRFVIDASGVLSPPNPVVALPLFDTPSQPLITSARGGNRVFVCPHAASIVMAGLVLRLAERIDIRHISALVFLPASEFGPSAIDELQKQTIGLLNFGEVPRKVFGAQIAFNLSPRLGGKGEGSLSATEKRIRSELELLLAGRTALPALRLVQVPSFYSMSFSIYIESPQRVTEVQIEQALSGDNVRWVRASQPSASPAEAQGSSTLLLDPAILEPSQPGGFWLWGRVDDLRLQAENAVMIAEHLAPFIGDS